MGSIKHRIGVLLLILCLGAMIAAVWYGLFGFARSKKEMDGTLVKIEKMIRI